MLNLLLLTCVNAKQPQRGLGFLQQAHKLELASSEKIVDVVSYNTVIKGFAQVGELSRCFDSLAEMTAHGLEPDDITCATLLDACVGDVNMDATDKIVDLVLGRDRPINTVM